MGGKPCEDLPPCCGETPRVYETLARGPGEWVSSAGASCVLQVQHTYHHSRKHGGRNSDQHVPKELSHGFASFAEAPTASLLPYSIFKFQPLALRIICHGKNNAAAHKMGKQNQYRAGRAPFRGIAVILPDRAPDGQGGGFAGR